MQIIHLVDNFYPAIGGAQYVAGELAKAQASRGDAVAIVVTGYRSSLPERTEWNGIPVHRFDFRSAVEERDIEKVAGAVKAMRRLRETFRPDVSHIHMWGPGVLLHMQSKETAPGPWVVTVHCPVPKATRGSGINLGKILRSAPAVAAVSEYSRRDILSHTGDDCRVEVVYNAIRMSNRPIAALPWEPPLLLCTGRMVPEKGFDIAIEALARIHTQFPETRLAIAGDGPERTSLECRARALGVIERTEFLGWVAPDQLPSLQDRSTIILVPSRDGFETFGLVAAEAAIAGRPVVAARDGGLPEVVLDGRTGILVPPDDSNALANAVMQLLENRDLAIKFGTQAADLAKVRFSLDSFITGYDQLYCQAREQEASDSLAPGQL